MLWSRAVLGQGKRGGGVGGGGGGGGGGGYIELLEGSVECMEGSVGVLPRLLLLLQIYGCRVVSPGHSCVSAAQPDSDTASSARDFGCVGVPDAPKQTEVSVARWSATLTTREIV